MNQAFQEADAALNGLLFDGLPIAAGGFGLCGIPETLIDGIVTAHTVNLPQSPTTRVWMTTDSACC